MTDDEIDDLRVLVDRLAEPLSRLALAFLYATRGEQDVSRETMTKQEYLDA
jgi:hypothetical protein